MPSRRTKTNHGTWFGVAAFTIAPSGSWMMESEGPSARNARGSQHSTPASIKFVKQVGTARCRGIEPGRISASFLAVAGKAALKGGNGFPKGGVKSSRSILGVLTTQSAANVRSVACRVRSKELFHFVAEVNARSTQLFRPMRSGQIRIELVPNRMATRHRRGKAGCVAVINTAVTTVRLAGKASARLKQRRQSGEATSEPHQRANERQCCEVCGNRRFMGITGSRNWTWC